jgi:hypothetical protein
MTDTQNLENSLKNLLLEIKSLDVGDQAAQQKLQTLVQNIEKMLEQPNGGGANAKVGDRWRATIIGFEASHPRLAGVMNEVVAELSNMGI